MNPGKGALTPMTLRLDRLPLEQAQAVLQQTPRGVAVDEPLQMRGDIGELQIAAVLDLAGDMRRHFRPMLCGVGSDDPDRTAIPSSLQILDDRVNVRNFHVGFAPSAASTPKSSVTR